MKGWIRPWRGLNLSQYNRVPDARVIIWDGRSRWARDRIHEWWRLLVGAEVEVAARQRATYEMGSWDLRGRVLETSAEGNHLRLVLQPGGEVEAIAQRIDLDLRLGVLRIHTRVGRVLWVRRLGTLWRQNPYHAWGQLLTRAYTLVLQPRVSYNLEVLSWSSYLHNAVFNAELGRRFCGAPELEITLPLSGRAEVGETGLDFSAPLLWLTALTGAANAFQIKALQFIQSSGQQGLLLRSWKQLIYNLDAEVLVYSPTAVVLDKPWYINSPSLVILNYTLAPLGQTLWGTALHLGIHKPLGVGLSYKLRHWQGVWPIYSREPVVANLFRSRLLRHGL